MDSYASGWAEAVQSWLMVLGWGGLGRTLNQSFCYGIYTFLTLIHNWFQLYRRYNCQKNELRSLAYSYIYPHIRIALWESDTKYSDYAPTDSTSVCIVATLAWVPAACSWTFSLQLFNDIVAQSSTHSSATRQRGQTWCWLRDSNSLLVNVNVSKPACKRKFILWVTSDLMGNPSVCSSQLVISFGWRCVMARRSPGSVRFDRNTGLDFSGLISMECAVQIFRWSRLTKKSYCTSSPPCSQNIHQQLSCAKTETRYWDTMS